LNKELCGFRTIRNQKKGQFMNTNETLQKPAPAKPLNQATLRARHDAGLLNLEEAFEEAIQEAGTVAPTAPKPEPRWLSSKGPSMTWQAGNMGSVTVKIQGNSLGEVQEHGTNAWAPIILDNFAPCLTFEITSDLATGVRLLYCQTGKILKDATEQGAPRFMVPLVWEQGVPHTEKTASKDMSLVLVSPFATFIQLEVAVTTRNGYFWLSFQELCAGQIARTTKEKAACLEVTTMPVGDYAALVVPLYPENSYPGADFLKTRDMVHSVVEYAVGLGISKPLSKCSMTKWEPVERVLPEQMQRKGWKKATVLFFNFSWGQGFAICEDGTKCHLHFSKVIDENGRPLGSKREFPVLNPMTQIAIKLAADNDRGPDAAAIRVL
jgi:cold shock CspA family protein